MKMNLQRSVFALILAIQAGCVGAVTQGVFPKWTAYFLLVGTVLQSFMNSITTPVPSDKPAAVADATATAPAAVLVSVTPAVVATPPSKENDQ